MRRFLFCSALLLLSACAIRPGVKPNRSAETPAVSSGAALSETAPQTEEDETAVMPKVETGTGTYVPEERLLPTGILDVGSTDAPLVLFVWTNHSCRYCGEFQTSHVPRLLEDFVKDGKLRIQIAILPLKKYPQSRFLTSALHCALRQGNGLAMHTSLTATQPGTLPALLTQVAPLGLDAAALRTCMEESPTQFLLDQQTSLARTLGVTVVPTFFLNGEKSEGLPYYPDLRGMIEEALEPR